MKDNKKFYIPSQEEMEKYKHFCDMDSIQSFIPIDFLPKQVKSERTGNEVAELIKKLTEQN